MFIPAIYNPVLQQGDKWDWAVSLTTYLTPTSSATTFDLTGYTAKSQLRKKPEATKLMLEFTCDIPTPSLGQINLTAYPSATAFVPAGTYAWDLQISGTSGTVSGNVYTILSGYAAVSPDVTR